MLQPQFVRIAEEIASSASNTVRESIVYKYIPALQVVRFTTWNSDLSTSLPIDLIKTINVEELTRFVATRIKELKANALTIV